MGMYNVEVEGHYCAVIEVDASSPDEAEEFALRAFEEDYECRQSGWRFLGPHLYCWCGGSPRRGILNYEYCGGIDKGLPPWYNSNNERKEMTTYYLGIGYGNTFTDGVFVDDPTLPIDGDNDILENVNVHVDDDPYNYDEVVSHYVSKLKENDRLIVLWRNQAELYILDEWAEDFNIPQNQREELWNSEGIEETYIYFIDAEEENWYWLANAQVDYYDDNGRPVPIYPADEEEDE